VYETYCAILRHVQITRFTKKISQDIFALVFHTFRPIYFRIWHLYEVNTLSSLAGRVTCYRLEGPGIESRCRRDFPHPFITALGSNQRSVKLGIRSLSRGYSVRGVALTTHTHVATYTSSPSLDLYGRL